MPSYVTYVAGAITTTGSTNATGIFTISPLTTTALTPITITITLTDNISVAKAYTFIVTPLDNLPTFTTVPPN